MNLTFRNLLFWLDDTLPPEQATEFGRMVASAGGFRGGERGATLELWDVATDRSLGDYQEFAQPFTCVAFSPDGRTLATGSIHESGLVVIWDVDRSQLSSKRPLKPRATFR